jgi:hypothetical protein
LSLVEVMIAGSISALLLIAVAAAFRASAEAIEENDRFFSAAQAARVSLTRILTQVRRGVVDQASTSTSLHLITGGTAPQGGSDVTYNYDSANKQIILVTNNDLTDGDYALAQNVSNLTFSYDTGRDSQGLSCVSRVVAAITVQVGNNVVRLSGAAAPRRNLTY